MTGLNWAWALGLASVEMSLAEFALEMFKQGVATPWWEQVIHRIAVRFETVVEGELRGAAGPSSPAGPGAKAEADHRAELKPARPGHEPKG